MDDLRRRIERVEEAIAFSERAQEEAAAHTLDLLRRLDRLVKRLDSIERRLDERARTDPPDPDPSGASRHPEDSENLGDSGGAPADR